MPRYFFDIHDGPECAADLHGEDLESVEEARQHAQAVLADILREAMPDGEDRSLLCEVRDAAHDVVYRGRLQYRGEGASL